MPIHKHDRIKHHNRPAFTPVDNETFLAISAVDGLAAAIWVYLLSKPEDWIIRPTDVQRHFNIGKDSYYARLKVLRNFGVYWNTRSTSADGRFQNGVIHVSYRPHMATELPSAPKGHTDNLPIPDNPEPGPENPEPGPGYRYTGKPESGKRAPLLKKDSLQKKDSTKSASPPKKVNKIDSRKSRDIPLSEMLIDTSWAGDSGG